MRDRKRWSLGFVFTSGLEHVILLQKSRSLHIGLWNGLGGALDNNESPISSMVRECQEESGIQTQKEDWMKVGKLVGTSYLLLSKTSNRLSCNSWSVHIFTLHRFGHPEHADTRNPREISRDKVAYIPVKEISNLNMAPYTGALIHLSLEKLKNRLIPEVLIRTD